MTNLVVSRPPLQASRPKKRECAGGGARAQQDEALAGRLAQLRSSLAVQTSGALYRATAPSTMQLLSKPIDIHLQAHTSKARVETEQPALSSYMDEPDQIPGQRQSSTAASSSGAYPGLFRATERQKLRQQLSAASFSGASWPNGGLDQPAKYSAGSLQQSGARESIAKGNNSDNLMWILDRYLGPEQDGDVGSVLWQLEAERRQAVWAKYCAERQMRAMTRSWRICERLHAQARVGASAVETRLEAACAEVCTLSEEMEDARTFIQQVEDRAANQLEDHAQRAGAMERRRSAHARTKLAEVEVEEAAAMAEVRAELELVRSELQQQQQQQQQQGTWMCQGPDAQEAARAEMQEAELLQEWIESDRLLAQHEGEALAGAVAQEDDNQQNLPLMERWRGYASRTVQMQIGSAVAANEVS